MRRQPDLRCVTGHGPFRQFTRRRGLEAAADEILSQARAIAARCGDDADIRRVVAVIEVHHRELAAGANPVLVRRGIQRGVAAASDALKTQAVPLARAGNRSRLLMIIDNNCCPEQGMVYVAATDTISIQGPTVSRYGPKVSADSTGSSFLIDQSLFDGNLNFVRTFTSSSYALGSSSALAPDGRSAYLATDYGYLQVRTGDGVVVDTVRTGQTYDRFIAVSSGAWLVGVAGNPQLGPQRLVLVDLR